MPTSPRSISPQRWAQLSPLLDAALDLPPEARAAFLDSACGDDAALRAEAGELLAQGGRESGLLGRPAPEYAAPLVAADAAPSVTAGARVGPYRVLRELGRGGMGVVYLAERADDQYRKQVALKVVRGAIGLDDHLVRRFIEERQILASLDHPHIARLLDGGVTDDGLPWFAMEYVEGRPIDAYASERGLSVDDRLALFLPVCDALHYAHRQLVVHRDLKPSNILVSASGEVKLLDFGIAKLLDAGDAGDAEGATRTGTGLRAMTPEYASPEQVRGEPVTVASDVYSLGVLLYELLCGARPYRVTGRTPLEAERAILEEEPERPSARATDPRTARRLRGDLDTIVLAAMRKEPERRYPGADQLAADLRRHLGGRPVSARADSRRYRAGKFVRRHRVGVLASAALLLSLVGGIAGTAWQARAASREAAKEREVRDFVVGLFEGADPSSARGRAVTARELLDRGASRLQSAELRRQPEVRAEMLSVLGNVYRALGLYDQAAPLLEQSLALSRARYGGRGIEVGEGLNDLGVLYTLKGDFPRADSLLAEALTVDRTAAGAGDTAALTVLTNVAELRRFRGDLAGADSILRDVVRRERALLGPSSPTVATTLNLLGVVARRRLALAEAEDFQRQALAIRRANYGEDHPDVAESLKNLALVLHSAGRWEAAESTYRKALALQRHIFGVRHPEVATTLHSLGALRFMRGDAAGAEPLVREAISINRELSPGQPETANSLTTLGTLLTDEGRLAEADSLLTEALAIRRRAFGEANASVATSLLSLAYLRQAQHRETEADTLLRRGLGIYKAKLGPRHTFVATALDQLARLRLSMGDGAAAESLARQALDIQRAALPPTHPDLANSGVVLGNALVLRGASAEAEPLLREALDIRAKALPAGDWRRVQAEEALGSCLAALGRYAEAEPLLTESLDGLPPTGGGWRVVAERRRTLRALASLYEELGRRADAARYHALLAREFGGRRSEFGGGSIPR